MKRVAFILGMAAMFMASCSVQDNKVDVPAQDREVFYASFEQPAEGDTRVYVNEDLFLRWTADDRISIFNKNTYNQQYRFTGETGANSGGFSKVGGEDFFSAEPISNVIAVYPFMESSIMNGSGVLTTSFPEEQVYSENSFGQGANLMVSVSSDNLLLFKNVGAYLRFRLYGAGISVSSIVLKGNKDEKIAGKVSVTMPLGGVPSVEMATDAATEITLACNSPVPLGATADEGTDFWFVVPPVTFSEGFTITVNNVAGKIFEKTTTKNIVLERGKLHKMSPLELEQIGPVGIIEFADLNLKAACVSNWDVDGDGELSYAEAASVTSISGAFGNVKSYTSFDEFQYFTGVTSIPSGMFRNWTKLTSISLPESITSVGRYAFTGCSRLTAINSPLASEDNRCLILDGVLVAFAPADVTDYVIPSSVTKIGASAFQECSHLLTITIPQSVKNIGTAAFLDANSLKRITVEAQSVPMGATDMFTNTNECFIYVPLERLKNYKRASYWKNYDSRIISDIPVPEPVDVGQKVKWASFNLGATKPEDYGFYYSWGEIAPKTYYTWKYYKYCDGTKDTLTKYTDTSSGLEDSDDPARVFLGGKWRMPTWAEYYALISKFNWRWESDYNSTGVSGIVAWMQYSNGEKIDYLFFPAGGGYDSSTPTSVGSLGGYWISDRKSYNSAYCYDILVTKPEYAIAFLYRTSDLDEGNFTASRAGGTVLETTVPRSWGLNIRPVWDPNL